ncbi:MAG: hypothetical protein ACK57U_05310, partial [Planctomycetota bacterium]
VFAPAPGSVFSSSAGASRQPPVRPLFFVSRVFAPAPGSAAGETLNSPRKDKAGMDGGLGVLRQGLVAIWAQLADLSKNEVRPAEKKGARRELLAWFEGQSRRLSLCRSEKVRHRQLTTTPTMACGRVLLVGVF